MEFILLPTLIVLLFYFILLKPMLNAQKKHRSNIANLEIGDEVLTTGGFFALVLDIETQDDGPPVIVLEVAPGVELEGTPNAIAEVNPRGRPEDELDDDDPVDETDDANNDRNDDEDTSAADEPARIEAAE